MLIEKLNDGKYKLSITPGGLSKNHTFIEQKDKFLYDKNKTIGFRKDKKLNKFVGLRDGYSKQLEFSLVSVVLDGINKIPKNRVNFSSVSLINDVIVHDINNTKFYNEITDTNFKNQIEITNPFDNLQILYEVHTTGIEVSNYLSGDRYSRGNNQFVFVDKGNKKPMFIIDSPSITDADGNSYNIVDHKLFIKDNKLFYKKEIGRVTDKYKFPLLIDVNVIYDVNVGIYSGNTIGQTGAVGVISSTGATWVEATGGTGVLSLVHTSSVGTFEESVGVQGISGSFRLNRTFLNFNTSIFSGYTDILSSIKLNFHDYILNDEGIAVMKCTSTGKTLTTNDWNNVGEFYNSGSTIVKNDITQFELPLSVINLDSNVDSGLTRIVILSIHDYNNSGGADIYSFTGMDFNHTTLEVIYEPIKVYGQTELNVIKGDYFWLSGYTNSGYTEIERETNRNGIEWYTNSGYTGYPIAIGPSMSGYSMQYIGNNIIYAVLPLPQFYRMSDPLVITLNIIRLGYDSLPEKYINYDAINLDSIYFKYHKCLSGVCYSYVRDINNIYEGFPLVSDAWGNESYNLYNEFDIIDEFFSNSHDVEIAYNENLDLTRKYKELDGVPLHDGTRILLMNQTDLNELGIYVVQYDFTLKRIDELNTYDDMFRYKAQVGAGTYADQEIHIWPILPPLETPYITISPNPITFIWESGYTQSVFVVSNTSWSLYSAIPWINVSTSNGAGNKEIIIKSTKTNNTLSTRTGIIEFSGYGDITYLLTVYQTPNMNEIMRVLTDGYTRTTTSGDVRIVLTQ